MQRYFWLLLTSWLLQDWNVLYFKIDICFTQYWHVLRCSTQDWHVLYQDLHELYSRFSCALLKITMCSISRLACAQPQFWQVIYPRLAYALSKICALHKIGMCFTYDWLMLYSRLACAVPQDKHVLYIQIGMCSTQDWHVLYSRLACDLPNICMCSTQDLHVL